MIIKKALKSGESSFTARVFGDNGRPYHKTFRSEVEAQRWKGEEEKKREDELNSKNILAEEYFESYFKSIKVRVGISTYKGYFGWYRRNILPVIRGKKIMDIELDDAVVIQKNMADKGYSINSNNKVLRLFSQVLRHASTGNGKHRVFDEHPLGEFKTLRLRKKEMLFWVKEEADYFFAHEEVKKNYYYDFMRVAVNTGMRMGEIAGLQVKKIDFSTNSLVISSALKRQEKGLGLGATKTGKIRYLKMNNTVREIMRKRVERKGADDFIFPGKRMRHISITDFTTKVFYPLQKRIGVKKIIRFHDLRHTFASNYFMNGGDFFCGKEMLGHAASETTLLYAHIGDKFKQNEANRIQF